MHENAKELNKKKTNSENKQIINKGTRSTNLLDFMAGDLVPVLEIDLERILGLVVAMPAVEDLAAARGPYLAPPHVMRAAVRRL